jgi:hypothetical protein
VLQRTFQIGAKQGVDVMKKNSASFANFLRKNSIFLKKQCYDPLFAEFSSNLRRKPQIFCRFFCRFFLPIFLQFFWRKKLKNHNIGSGALLN